MFFVKKESRAVNHYLYQAKAEALRYKDKIEKIKMSHAQPTQLVNKYFGQNRSNLKFGAKMKKAN